MDTKQLKDLAQRVAHSPALMDTLGGVAAGQVVCVVGSGPSAAKCDRKKLPKDSWVIACNAAIKLKDLKPDVHLCGEAYANRQDWFAGNANFPGHFVWERFNTNDAERMLQLYKEELLSRVLWCHRGKWHPQDDPRKQGQGLWHYGDPTGLGEPLGTTGLQAIHLACIMGAKAVHLYGMELHFPAGQQYVSKANPFKPGDGPLGLVNFEIVDGAPVLKPSGKYSTIRYFLDSAPVIRQVIESSVIPAGIEVVDHSGGLLYPEKMNAGEQGSGD